MYGTSGYADETGGGGYTGSGGTDVIGAVIGAGAGLYDSYQNRKASKLNTIRTINANKAEAELAYQRSLDMWNKQNLYNTPEAQMQRFNQAGLNPHLIYGQGSGGNAQGFPEYQPAEQRYNIEAAQYGAPIASILPTLMAVGTWMQNMRLTEAELKNKNVGAARTETDTERIRQLIEYLSQKNPQALTEGANKISLFPYQKEAQRFGAQKAYIGMEDMEQSFRAKYGEELYRNMRHDSASPPGQLGGLIREKFLQEQSATKLKQAQASWADMDITNPQALMMMVLNGVMGMAGASMRMRAPGKGPQVNKGSALPSRSRSRAGSGQLDPFYRKVKNRGGTGWKQPTKYQYKPSYGPNTVNDRYK